LEDPGEGSRSSLGIHSKKSFQNAWATRNVPNQEEKIEDEKLIRGKKALKRRLKKERPSHLL